MFIKRLIFILIALQTILGNSAKYYHNFTLFRAIPVNKIQLEFFKNLSDAYDVNFWRDPSTIDRSVEVVVSPESKDLFLIEARRIGIYLTTLIPNIQRAFNLQTVSQYVRRKMDTFNWRHYYHLDDIYRWLQDLASIYPKEIKIRSIGRTHEGRDIVAVKLVLEGNKKRSKAMIEGGIHAREWISPAFVTYLIDRLLHANEDTDQAFRNIAYTYEWHIIPVLNPDGYAYSHTTDRLWRKNRRNGINSVDLNRNFDVAFEYPNSDFVKSSNTYPGEAPFSEKESIALSSYVHLNSHNLEFYINFHSYGQMFIIPYTYTKNHEANYDEVKKKAIQAGTALYQKYHTLYSAGNAFETIGYVVSGVSSCWVKKSYKVPYVLTFELRDTGNDGFALPPHLILPTCQETLDGLVAFMTPSDDRYIKHKYWDETHSSGNKISKLGVMSIICIKLIVFILIN